MICKVSLLILVSIISFLFCPDIDEHFVKGDNANTDMNGITTLFIYRFYWFLKLSDMFGVCFFLSTPIHS